MQLCLTLQLGLASSDAVLEWISPSVALGGLSWEVSGLMGKTMRTEPDHPPLTTSPLGGPQALSPLVKQGCDQIRGTDQMMHTQRLGQRLAPAQQLTVVIGESENTI